MTDERKPGKLYVVATPIGNLGDFSPRAVETLEAVDFIAAEDTRVGAKLLNKFEIKKPQISYFEHNRHTKGEYIVERILGGESCAIITDAGTPAISDPGTDLVDLCARNGIEVTAVPGCSAVVAALSISGMACGRFTFEGFLSPKKGRRTKRLSELISRGETFVFYESPYRIVKTLKEIGEIAPSCRIAMGRELTKAFEEILVAPVSEVIASLESRDAVKGEFAVAVCPKAEADDNAEEDIES